MTSTAVKRSLLAFLLGLSAVLLWNCGPGSLPGSGPPRVESLEQARAALEQSILPNIEVSTEVVSDAAAARYTTDATPDPLPRLEDFPLYGATPQPGDNPLYVEIFSSSEKANVERQNERWLVEVAEAFNQRQVALPSGQVVQVGVRQVPSGT
ncbi:MAG: hypothetical protein ACKO63_16980, partial [Nodosilinea sp.]